MFFRAPEGQRNSGERGGSGVGFGGDPGRSAREAIPGRAPRPVRTGWTALSPHPSSCRFAGPPRRHPYCGPILGLLGAVPRTDSPLPGARTPHPLQSWAKKCTSWQTPHSHPPNHTQWQMDVFVAGLIFFFFLLVGSILNLFLTWCPLC